MGFLGILGRVVIFTPLGGIGAPILGVLGVGAGIIAAAKFIFDD